MKKNVSHLHGGGGDDASENPVEKIINRRGNGRKFLDFFKESLSYERIINYTR